MMLDTAFGKKYGSKAPTTSQMEAWTKGWSYVGRFVWGFAMIENTVNQLFFELIGGHHNPPNQASSTGIGLLLTYSFDLRKKIDLIQIILKRRGIDESKNVQAIASTSRSKKHYHPFPF